MREFVSEMWAPFGFAVACFLAVVTVIYLIAYRPDHTYHTTRATVLRLGTESAGLGRSAHVVATTDGRVFYFDTTAWLFIQPGHTYTFTIDEDDPPDAWDAEEGR